MATRIYALTIITGFIAAPVTALSSAPQMMGGSVGRGA